MPFCPRCRAEYRDGFEICGSCDVALVENIEDIPEPLNEETVAQRLKDKELSAVVRGGVEACKEVHAALLIEQIPAIIRTPEDVEGFSAVAMVLEVVVAKEELERAVHLLQADWHDMMDRDGLEFSVAGVGVEADEDEEPPCPGCGSTQPLEDGVCPECGLNLG